MTDDLLVSWEMGPALLAYGLVGPGDVVFEVDLAETWNGWLVPVFTRDQIDAVIAATVDAPERVALSSVDDAVVFVMEDGEEIAIKSRTLADGTVVYPVEGWTWDVAETA